MKKQIQVITDDLTQEELPPGEGETIGFQFDGVRYEIDLSEDSIRKMREAFQPYIESARKLGGKNKSRTLSNASDTTQRSGEEKKMIRDWANANGHAVGDRGRIPAAVVEAYDAAN